MAAKDLFWEHVMDTVLALAGENLLSPIVLFFALGFAASMARSELSVPEAAAKTLSLYLLFAIGFKGGAGVAEFGLSGKLIWSLVAGVFLSAVLPFVAYAMLRFLSKMSRMDAAAVAGHYGSISIVTFVAATSILQDRGIAAEGFMVAVAAAMEAPAIMSAIYLASRSARSSGGGMEPGLLREVMLNGSIVLLVGSFLIGWISGPDGLAEIESFIVSPFKGVLCLFLLDMGLIAGRGLRGGKGVIGRGAVAFAVVMPIVGSMFGLAAGMLIGLELGGIVLFMVLSASASYIAVPAAMRVALPEANPSIYLTLSLAVTFPFNLTLGIPIYLAIASAIAGA